MKCILTSWARPTPYQWFHHANLIQLLQLWIICWSRKLRSSMTTNEGCLAVKISKQHYQHTLEHKIDFQCCTFLVFIIHCKLHPRLSATDSTEVRSSTPGFNNPSCQLFDHWREGGGEGGSRWKARRLLQADPFSQNKGTSESDRDASGVNPKRATSSVAWLIDIHHSQEKGKHLPVGSFQRQEGKGGIS